MVLTVPKNVHIFLKDFAIGQPPFYFTKYFKTLIVIIPEIE